MSGYSYWDRFRTAQITRRRALGGLSAFGASAVALGLVGCGGGDNEKGAASNEAIRTPDDTTKQAKAGGTLRDFVTADLLHFDALASNSSAVVNQISVYAYPRLLRYSTPTFPKLADSSVEGESAVSFEESPDGMQITFKLRPSMKWDARAPTNGRPLDSSDVLFSFRKYKAVNPSAVDLSAIESLTAPDANTVVAKLSEFDPSLLPLLADWARFYVMPRESESGFDPKTVVRGHGPWLLEEYQPSTRVVWARNPNYWMPNRPFFDRIEKPIIPEYAARLAQFRAGNIYTSVVDSDDLLQTKKDLPATNLYQGAMFPTSIGSALCYGYDGDSIFKDTRVRQAASLSIDRDAYSDALYGLKQLKNAGIDVDLGYGTIVPPGFPNYWLDPTDTAKFGKNSVYFTHNIAEAKKLLSAAGIADKASFNFYTNGDNQYGAIYSTERDILDAMWRDAGFTPNQVAVPYAQWIPNYHNAYSSGKGFNGAALRTGAASATVDTLLSRWYKAGGSAYAGITPNGNNAAAGDPQVNSAIDSIKRERDSAKKQSLIHELIRYYSGMAYLIVRPTSVKTLSLVWPVLGNFGVYVRPLNGNLQTEEAIHWWFDESKPPVAKS